MKIESPYSPQSHFWVYLEEMESLVISYVDRGKRAEQLGEGALVGMMDDGGAGRDEGNGRMAERQDAAGVTERGHLSATERSKGKTRRGAFEFLAGAQLPQP